MRQQDFYATVESQPFRRDISDRRRYFEQRDSLLRHLGIPPALLRGADILEIGPGHGENALFLLQFAPRAFDLIEVSAECAEACRALLDANNPGGTSVAVHQRAFEDLSVGASTDPAYDLVIFEGVIPFEPDPPALLRRTGRCVRPGGLLAITTIDAVSLFAEALRRLIGLLRAPASLAPQARVARLTPLFAPHLATLAGMSRRYEDWVLDQMVHPWSGKPFSLLEAAETLSDSFDFYGSSPHFVTDLRWYRDIHGDRGYLEVLRDAYFRNLHNLIDCRFERPPAEPTTNRALAADCRLFLDAVRGFEAEQSGQHLDSAVAAARRIAAHLEVSAPETAASVVDGLVALECHLGGETRDDFGAFTGLFGRGQQNVSFIRHH